MDSQDCALISLMVTEYKLLIAKITSLEDKHKASDNQILNLEARLDEAQVETLSEKLLTRRKNHLNLLKGNKVIWLNMLQCVKQNSLPNDVSIYEIIHIFELQS